MHDWPRDDSVPEPPNTLLIRTPQEIRTHRFKIALRRLERLREANLSEPIYLDAVGEERNWWRYLDNESDIIVPSVAQQMCWRDCASGREAVFYTTWGWVTKRVMKDAKRRYQLAYGDTKPASKQRPRHFSALLADENLQDSGWKDYVDAVYLRPPEPGDPFAAAKAEVPKAAVPPRSDPDEE